MQRTLVSIASISILGMSLGLSPCEKTIAQTSLLLSEPSEQFEQASTQATGASAIDSTTQWRPSGNIGAPRRREGGGTR